MPSNRKERRANLPGNQARLMSQNTPVNNTPQLVNPNRTNNINLASINFSILFAILIILNMALEAEAKKSSCCESVCKRRAEMTFFGLMTETLEPLQPLYNLSVYIMYAFGRAVITIGLGNSAVLLLNKILTRKVYQDPDEYIEPTTNVEPTSSSSYFFGQVTRDRLELIGDKQESTESKKNV